MQNAKKIIHCKLNEHNIYMLKNKEKRFIMDLKYEKKDIYSKLNGEEIKNVYSYVDEYLEFLNKGKIKVDLWTLMKKKIYKKATKYIL